ncbi:MAG: hypothetical protein ACRCX2_34005 [Paraclostridium sp.]
MELLLIECVECKITFGTTNDTGDHKCPECDCKNERYIFSEDTTEEEIKLACEIHKEIKEIFSSYGVKGISNIKIMNLILDK